MSNYNIITSQFVQITQTPASIGERILAYIIDCILSVIYTIIVVAVIYIYKEQTKSEVYPFLCIFLLPALLYFPLCEIFYNGQTIGKHLIKIRVVKKDGSQPTVSDYFLRWILKLIDIGFYGLGVFVILSNKHGQRLGDIAAGTMVVKLEDYAKMHISLDEFYYAKKDYKPTYPKVQDLSPGQIDVIEKTLNANYEEERTNKLADKVMKFLDLTPKEHNSRAFLTTILYDYQYYEMELI